MSGVRISSLVGSRKLQTDSAALWMTLVLFVRYGTLLANRPTGEISTSLNFIEEYQMKKTLLLVTRKRNFGSKPSESR